MNDLEIYKKAASILEIGQNIAMITVTSTTGSTPGRIGYKMLVWGKHGETMGTVGGGLTEAKMIKMAEDMLPETKTQLFRFELDGTQDDEKGICGGSVEFLIETFDKRNLPLFEELSTAIANGENGVLVSTISPGKSPHKIFLKNIDRVVTEPNINFPPEIIGSIRKLAVKEQSAKKMSAGEVQVFAEVIAEQPMVVIFGAGHLSWYISRYAKSLHFRTTVCDERSEFANKERFPDADNIIVSNFDSVFDKINIDTNSYIVIVTRGHDGNHFLPTQW